MRDVAILVAAVAAVVGWGMQRSGVVVGAYVCWGAVGLALLAWAMF